MEVADPGGESPSEDMFKLLIKQGGQVAEEFDRATLGRGKQNVATMVNAASKLIRIDEDAGERGHQRAGRRPGQRVAGRAAGAAPAVPSPRLTTDDYVGDAADRTGFGGLEAVEEVTMVACRT